MEKILLKGSKPIGDNLTFRKFKTLPKKAGAKQGSPRRSGESRGFSPIDFFEADVIVYGGTSAAIMTAVQVAKMGMSVILVSPDKHLGGLSSSGLGWTDVGNKEVIGGLAREFYHRVYLHYQKSGAWIWQSKEEYGDKGQSGPATDEQKRTMWVFEPHVAETIFNELLAEYNIPVYKTEFLDRENGVNMRKRAITSIETLSEESCSWAARKIFKGKIFVDATYEGDLMASAGVSYCIGREGCDVYDEKWNGIQMEVFHHDHHFKNDISPYVVADNPKSGVLPRISAYAPRVQCHGDEKIQAYCFRMCLTKHVDNKVPITKPKEYDPSQYELLIRVFDSGWNEFFAKFDPLPNWKTDVNNHGPFSFDNIGMNYNYPEASYQRRNEIIKEHRIYQQGLLYFIATDPRIPPEIQKEMNEWGYAKDEFIDNDHWPYQLYVREARRMIGKYVITENDILGKRIVPNPIGMGSYTMDSHNVQRYITCNGFVQNEGDIGVHPEKPYQIALDSILPKKEECQNLVVPVALSSSHIAFGSLRMEPVFMVLGQSAGTLAALALENAASNVHDVAYDQIKARLLQDGQVLEWV
jgi:hypothetical protein